MGSKFKEEKAPACRRNIIAAQVSLLYMVIEKEA